MSAHRQRRWPTFETTQGQCHVFAGGAHGANRSVTIQLLDEGGDIVCIHLRLRNNTGSKSHVYWYDVSILEGPAISVTQILSMSEKTILSYDLLKI